MGGAMSASRLLRLGDLTPERMPITFNHGETAVSVYGFVLGARCPGSVKAEAHAVWLRYQEALKQPEKSRLVAEMDYRRELLKAVIPDLHLDDADLIAGDE